MTSSMDTLVIRTENKFKTLTTKQAYKMGEVICPIPSENLTDRPTRYTVQIGRDSHTHVGKLAALNHSCDPNVILDTSSMVMVARREIGKDEELFFFYPSTEWEMQAPFICLCGSPNCIHVVAGARFLSLSTLENHYLNSHIRESMMELLNNTGDHLKRLLALEKRAS
ncbi:MAG: SET domain-containing protein [Anaerolineales bacterium]|nr:SET domain-containing protein [Anaerolineales bacterium]